MQNKSLIDLTLKQIRGNISHAQDEHDPTQLTKYMTTFNATIGPKFAIRIKEGFVAFGDNELIVGELGDFNESPPTLFSSREEAEEKAAAELDAADSPSVVRVGYFTTYEDDRYEVDKYFPNQAGPFKAGFQGHTSARYISEEDAQEAADEKNYQTERDDDSEWYYAVKEVVSEDETTVLEELEEQ